MNCGINTETTNRNVNMETIKDFFAVMPRCAGKFFALKAYADGESKEGEGNLDSDGTTKETTPTINYEDLISKARAEEKKKQYGTIKKLKEQIDLLTAQHNDDLLKVGQLEEDLKNAKEQMTTANKGDSEEVATLKEEIETLRKDNVTLGGRIKEFEDNAVDREAVEKEIRTQLEAEYTTKTYKATKMAELRDQILVPELVIGDTVEEIDESIKVALAKSKEIREKLGVEGYSSKSPQGRTPKTSGNPNVGGIQNAQFSEDYVASLDVSSPEYAEFRKQMGLR